MKTERLIVDPRAPSSDVLAQAATVLRGGGLVAFPTETVYGLGANALDAAAVARIFVAKGRPSRNPLIVHVAELEQARQLVTDWPLRAERLAAQFWPGPLTLVLLKRAVIPDVVTGGGPTVALRMPSLPVARELIRAAGVPLAAPSANRSTRISGTTADHVLRGLNGRIDIVLDGGATPGGLESTVLDLSSSLPRLLRPGLVSIDQIEAALAEPVLAGLATIQPGQPLPSPGLLARHYAPTVPVECLANGGAQRVEQLSAAGVRTGWIALGKPRHETVPDATIICLPDDSDRYAAGIYAALHKLEACGVERIVIDLPPDEPRWLAVRDRLGRASAEEE